MVPRRDNGLTAASYVPLADVDPPFTDQVLDLLAGGGVAAYAEPLAGLTGPYRDVRPPDRPTTRIHVDRTAVVRARDLLAARLPGMRADFLADAAARADRRDLAQSEVDAAWAGIVAGFDAPPAADAGPVPSWPVSEDLDPAGPDATSPDAAAPDAAAGGGGPDASPSGDGSAGRPPGLAGRLVRRAGTPGDGDGAGDDDGTGDPDSDDLLEIALGPIRLPDDPTDHYVPPHPPPLPAPKDTVQRFAWVGALGGPVILVASHVLGLESWIAGLGVAAMVAGFVTLVARKDDRGHDGWDDGAVV